MESRLFSRNRVLGYVSNAVPLRTRYIKKRKENIIVTCVGKSFYAWGSSRLTLLSVSPQHDADIHCLEGDTYLIFSASGKVVQAWRRGVELKHTYRSSSQTPVRLLLPFGPHLIGIDEANVLTIWDISSEDIYLELDFPNDTFSISAICHPYCYLNKVLLGSKQGSMQLWNLNSSKLVYSFVGWESTITALVPAPAVDVVAVGMQSGKIVLHNIKFDESVATFVQDWGGPVSQLSFCTDNLPIMASGSDDGRIVFWHLEERKAVGQLANAHDEAVCGLEYLPNERLLVSSSSDNSLKMWLFDVAKGSAHLIRVRQGHKSSPSLIRFYGALGNYVLSAGHDGYLHAFNVETEIANKNLGRALYGCSKERLKKITAAAASATASTQNDGGGGGQGQGGDLERELVTSKVLPIEYFSAESAREKDWDNIAALHSGKGIVSSWSFGTCKFSKFIGRRRQKNAAANAVVVAAKKVTTSCLCVTRCGNFVVVGYTSGTFDRFNIQSGLYRGTYGAPRAHRGWVTGLFVNNVNHFVASGGVDGYVKFWSFRRCEQPPFARIKLHDAVTFFRSHDETSLVAVALENYDVVVVDADCRSVIRKFAGHAAQLTDMAFSPDGRWLVSASMDATLRTWDLPSSKCVDAVALEKACVSVAFSPTAACIATAHVDCVGVTLWSNRRLFSLVPLDAVDPESSSARKLNADKWDVSAADSLVTFSNDDSVAITRSWRNILDADTIGERNRIREPPKIAPEAPFVLPIIPAVNVKFDLSADAKGRSSENAGSGARILKSNKLESRTLFAKTLLKCASESDFENAFEQLKGLSLMAIIFEIDSLAPDSGGSVSHLLQFMDMLKFAFDSRKCFEISSAFLSQFLKVHTSLILKENRLLVQLESLSELHDRCWSHLENKLSYSICISKFFIDS